MEIKVLILLAVLATIFTSVNSEEDHDFIVEILRPQGFRVTTANFPGLQRVGFRGNINKELLRHETAEYIGDFALHSNGWWVYEHPSASLNPGDSLYYRPQILSRTSGVESFAREFHVPIDTPSISTTENNVIPLNGESSDNDVTTTENDLKRLDEEPNAAQQFDGGIDVPSKVGDAFALIEKVEQIEDNVESLDGEVNTAQQFNRPTEVPSTSTTDAIEGLDDIIYEDEEYPYNTAY